MIGGAPTQRDDRGTMPTRGLDRVLLIADAVPYEGYVLFPYHAAATKNRFRWQFGVVVPEPQAALDASESAAGTRGRTTLGDGPLPPSLSPSGRPAT
jgi:hypothetical protein